MMKKVMFSNRGRTAVMFMWLTADENAVYGIVASREVIKTQHKKRKTLFTNIDWQD